MDLCQQKGVNVKLRQSFRSAFVQGAWLWGSEAWVSDRSRVIDLEVWAVSVVRQELMCIELEPQAKPR